MLCEIPYLHSPSLRLWEPFHLAPPFLLCVNVILGMFIDERRRAGELMTDAGVMNLHRNTTLFMRRDEVEPLIRQGVLEHLQTSVQ